MKAISKKLAGLALGAALAFTFMGCPGGVEEHEHTYSEDWSNNDTHHWHAATCDHTEEVADKAEHIYDDWTSRAAAPTYDTVEKKCKVCGYFAGSVRIEQDRYGNKVFSEYDCNGNIVKRTVRYPDGSVNNIIVYDNDGDNVEFTKYNTDGVLSIYYKAAEGGRISVVTNSDGTVNRIHEYNSNNDWVKFTKYNDDGSILIQYQAADGNIIGFIRINSDETVDSLGECGKQGFVVKYTKYNADGSVLIQYQAEDGNHILVDVTDDGNVDCIQECNSNEDLVKITKYNADGTVFFEVQAAEDKDIIVNTNDDGTLKEVVERLGDTWTKYTKYDADGKVCIQYEAADGRGLVVYTNWGDGLVSKIEEINLDDNRTVKRTFYYSDGSADYSEEYVNKYNKFTKYNADGSVLIEFLAAEGNTIVCRNDSEGSIIIKEYDEENYLIGYRSFNPDGTVDIEFVVSVDCYIMIYEFSDGSVSLLSVDKGF